MSQSKPRAPVLYSVNSRSARISLAWCDQPAPTMTLDKPLHNDKYPSALDIVEIALPIPVYIAAGVGLTTCMRVYQDLSGQASEDAARCGIANEPWEDR